MGDPLEGVAPDGTIVTGVSRERVAPVFEAAVQDVAVRLGALGDHVSVYLYGSVATGQARLGASDLDVLTIGVPAADAQRVGAELSERWRDVCRGVEVAPVANRADLDGKGDEAYGGRVFVRHYCVHLAGPDPAARLAAFPADARPARGFNGDIAQHLERWRAALDADEPPSDLARRVARKTLLAVAGLVSVHDGTWTTDRVRGAERWGVIDPNLAEGLATLLGWMWTIADEHRSHEQRADEVALVLDSTVRPVVHAFAGIVGLWR